MANHTNIQEGSANEGQEDSGEQKGEVNTKQSNSAPVKEALKKEKQPARQEDLSGLHDRKEIGTSGGDQRATESELEEGS